MPGYGIDCELTPSAQHFITLSRLHVLGGFSRVDNFGGNNIFDKIDTANKELNCIKHNIYSNITLHTDYLHGYGNYSYVQRADTTTNWLGKNLTYLTKVAYTSDEKATMYAEMKYLTENSFYEISKNNILQFGVIRRKDTGKWEYCLIDEGSEKSYFTLESKLFTYGTAGYQQWGDVSGTPANTLNWDNNENIYSCSGYFRELAGISSYGINQVSQLPTCKRTVALNNKPVFGAISANDQLSYSSTPLNPCIGQPFTTSINTAPQLYRLQRYNFFLSSDNFHAWDNDVFAIYTWPGWYDVSGDQWGSTWSNTYKHAKITGRDGHSGNRMGQFRYYNANTNNAYPVFRYIGNVLSSTNAYTSLLGVCEADGNASSGVPGGINGSIQRLPEINGDVFPSVDPTNPNDPYYRMWEGNYLTYPYPRSKQSATYVNENENDENVRRVPYKSGVSNTQFNTSCVNYDKTKVGNEGYLYDRDVILVTDNSSGFWYLAYEYDMNNVHTGGFPEHGVGEIEFELFYCTNINNVLASQTLFNFARKLNQLTSGFDTGILQEGHYGETPTAFNTVKIQQLDDYTNSSLIYGSTITINTTDSAFQNATPNTHSQLNMISVVPTVEIKNVYVWEADGTCSFTSKTLTGTCMNDVWTYGQYYLAYFAHKLFLIHKNIYDMYMYNATEFKQLALNMVNNSSYNYIADPYSEELEYGYHPNQPSIIDTHQMNENIDYVKNGDNNSNY